MSRAGNANIIDLGGSWRLRADPADQGLAERWFAPPEEDGWREDGEPIEIPCAWQQVLGPDYHGIAWLQRAVRLPRRWRRRRADHRLWLRFEAVATDCRAWVNGVEVGRHVGDSVPFQFDVSEAIDSAHEVDIVLRVDQVHAEPPEKEGDLQRGHITKGFHDVISLQHGGVWQPVQLVRTGLLCAIPDGISVHPDARTGRIRLHVQLEPVARRRPGQVRARIRVIEMVDAEAIVDWRASATVTPDATEVALVLPTHKPWRWRPAKPSRYQLEVQLRDRGHVSERHVIPIGFREIETTGSSIRLNGRPIFIRGVLDWGHEPEHIAPAPTPDEVRRRFQRLREMGFNCVCLCMWYPPRYFYDIADETGMLIWQEHPVWQSPMDDEHRDEYERMYEAFMRRDVNHPSVVIVSATCEHPSFNPALAGWWWKTARQRLPDRLLQLQTASFKWADAERTDLHDEHTYDNSNRWVSYLEDVQAHLKTLPAKPFVMGETVLFTAWPDVQELSKHISGGRPWWLPNTFEHQCALEQKWTDRYGRPVVERFRRQAERYQYIGRKFQVEQFRRYPNHVGFVMNHLRDVPQCQCGFMDDLDRWRGRSEQYRPWLGDAALLLLTPDQRRGFMRRSDRTIVRCGLALSNYGSKAFSGPVSVRVKVEETPPIEVCSLSLSCPRGEVKQASFESALPVAQKPKWMQVIAEAEGIPRNWWDLWVFPPVEAPPPPRAARLVGLPFEERDAQPDEVERGYSRGFGLPVRNWRCVLPDPAILAPELRAWKADGPIPRDLRAIVTHRLTGPLLDWMAGGGRIILLASKAAGGLGTRYEWIFGGVPLVIEEGPLTSGDSEWIVDLLGYDLVRRYCRVIPVEELGIADAVDPLIRLVYTHDQTEHARFLDFLFMTRVGAGLLMVSSLDHSEDTGQYLLRKLIAFAASDEASATRELDPAFLRRSCAGAVLHPEG
ncbi:MAG: glycoside hydrolase family 2 TIM barrel-domain containing protein [Planctomycetota bacterium]|nr:glycoside hydrolase family 2 TIM barrel-domain containing protein [Planctomycetota bacterium]